MDYTPLSTGVLEPRPPRLLDHVRERIRLRHYSIRTEQAYVGWGRRFILANDGAIRGNSVPEVEAFLTCLAIQGNVAAAYAADDEAGKTAGRSLRTGMRWSFMVAGQWG